MMSWSDDWKKFQQTSWEVAPYLKGKSQQSTEQRKQLWLFEGYIGDYTTQLGADY